MINEMIENHKVSGSYFFPSVLSLMNKVTLYLLLVPSKRCAKADQGSLNLKRTRRNTYTQSKNRHNYLYVVANN